MAAGERTDSPVDAVDAAEDVVLADDRFADRCLAVIRRIRRTGEEVVITHRGEPVARLLPIREETADQEEPVVWDLEAIGP